MMRLYYNIIFLTFKGNIYYIINYYLYSEPSGCINKNNENFVRLDNHINTTLDFIKFKKYLFSYTPTLDLPCYQHNPLAFNCNSTYFILKDIADYIALPSLGFAIVVISGALITIYFKPVSDYKSNLDVNYSEYCLFIKINVLINNLIYKVSKCYKNKVSDMVVPINYHINDILVYTTIINTNDPLGDMAECGGDGGDPPKKRSGNLPKSHYIELERGQPYTKKQRAKAASKKWRDKKKKERLPYQRAIERDHLLSEMSYINNELNILNTTINNLANIHGDFSDQVNNEINRGNLRLNVLINRSSEIIARLRELNSLI